MPREPRTILGSASPRRAQLLREAGVAFDVESSDVDETLPAHVEPENAACLLSERKARAVAARHAGEDALIVAADTIVAVGEDLLGKPVDASDARRMLERLSGSRHRVVTGVTVVHASRGTARAGFERTWVTMRAITPAEVEAYVASGEWRDKAGGYAIQENADRFVTRLEDGGFDNVVGLPVALTLRLVAEVRALARASGEG